MLFSVHRLRLGLSSFGLAIRIMARPITMSVSASGGMRSFRAPVIRRRRFHGKGHCIPIDSRPDPPHVAPYTVVLEDGGGGAASKRRSAKPKPERTGCFLG
jgi:hypothetical protein